MQRLELAPQLGAHTDLQHREVLDINKYMHTYKQTHKQLNVSKHINN